MLECRELAKEKNNNPGAMTQKIARMDKNVVSKEERKGKRKNSCKLGKQNPSKWGEIK